MQTTEKTKKPIYFGWYVCAAALFIGFVSIGARNSRIIFRVVLPNASLKDALLPTNMVSAQFGLTDALNVETFYGLEWKGHEMIPTGAFLNNQDYFGKGSNGVLVDLRSELGALAEGCVQEARAALAHKCE